MNFLLFYICFLSGIFFIVVSFFGYTLDKNLVSEQDVFMRKLNGIIGILFIFFTMVIR